MTHTDHETRGVRLNRAPEAELQLERHLQLAASTQRRHQEHSSGPPDGRAMPGLGPWDRRIPPSALAAGQSMRSRVLERHKDTNSGR